MTTLTRCAVPPQWLRVLVLSVACFGFAGTASAGLIGTTVTSCGFAAFPVAPCPSGNFWHGSTTAVVTNPGIEFQRIDKAGTNEESRITADIFDSSLTITHDLSLFTNTGFSGIGSGFDRQFTFSGLNFGSGLVISSVTLLGGNTLPLLSLAWTANSIDIVFQGYFVPRGTVSSASFQINTAPASVPEPSTLMLSALGLVASYRAARRRA
jgi:hypothetical protein